MDFLCKFFTLEGKDIKYLFLQIQIIIMVTSYGKKARLSESSFVLQGTNKTHLIGPTETTCLSFTSQLLTIKHVASAATYSNLFNC